MTQIGKIMPAAVSLRPAGLLWLAVALAGAGLFFAPGLQALLSAWSKPEYSHGPLIPLVSGFLLLRQLRNVPDAPVRPRDLGPGFALGLASLCLAFAGRLLRIDDFVAYGLILWVGAMLLLGFGWPRGRHLWPPVLHLVFMLPLPGVMYYGLSTWLQGVSSELGVYFLRLMSVPVFLDGNVIDLGVYKLQVAEACSGLRYLFPIMSFSYIFAILYRGPMWHKATLLLAAAPLSVLMNSVRIAIAGVVVDRYGLDHVEGVTHFLEGWVIFLTCVVLLFLLACVLLMFHPQRPRLPDALDLEVDGVGTQLARLAHIRQPRPMALAACGMALAAALAMALPERVPAPFMRESFTRFPVALAAWQGGDDQRLPPETEAILAADDYLLRLYADPAQGGAWVEFFGAWYQDEHRGGTHSPEVCLPAGGWEIASIRQVEVTGHAGPFSLNRVMVQKGLNRMLVYYWYDQQGLRTASSFRSKLALTAARVTTGRGDGAIVRLTTPILPGESEELAEARLQSMLQAVDRPLSRYLPAS